MREGWVETTLGDAAEVVMGQSPPGQSYNTDGNGLPFIQGSAEFGSRHPAPVKWCTQPRKIAQPGDLLISVRAPVGDMNFAEHEIAIGRGLSIVKGTDFASTDFLALAIENAMAELKSRSSGGMFESLTGAGLRGLPLPLPPLAEQRRIVDLIGAVDEVWLKTKALVDALGELESSVLDDLIWDRGHQVTQLRDVVSERGLIGGPFGSSLVSADYIEDGVPVIRGANLSEGRFVAGDFVFVSPEKSDSLKRNRAIPGDLVATQRGTLGQVALVSDRYPEYLVSQSQMRLRPDAALATAEYVYSALSTGRAKAAIEVRKIATANPHINLGIFGETEIPLPTLDAQIEVSKTHEALEDQHSALAAILGCLELCRRALLSDLLSGAHEIPDSYDDFLEAS